MANGEQSGVLDFSKALVAAPTQSTSRVASTSGVLNFSRALVGDSTVPTAPVAPAIAAAPTDLTTNTINPQTGTGYGLYPMRGPGGTIQVPFNKVLDAQRQGYRMDTDITNRFSRDLIASHPTFMQRLTTPSPHKIPHTAGQAAHEVERGVGNIGAGGLELATHPQQLVTSPYQQLKAFLPKYETVAGVPQIPVPNVEGMEQGWQQVKEIIHHPLETAETLLGQAAVTGMAEAPAEKVLGTAGEPLEPLRTKLKGATGISPLDIEKEAQKTVDENQKLVDKAKVRTEEIKTREATEAAKQRNDREKAIAKAEKARDEARIAAEKATDADQRAYFQKHAEHQQAVAQAEAENARLMDEHHQALAGQKALQESLNTSDRTAKSSLRLLEKRVHADAHALYEGLDEALAEKEADPQTMHDLAEHIDDQLDPAVGQPPIFKKFYDFIGKGQQVMNYSDLEKFRSAITRAMRKGNIGSAYHIYDLMLNGDSQAGIDGIIPEMDRIAEENGMTEQAASARAAWRAWAEAFTHPKSPLFKSLRDPEVHGLLKRLRASQSYLDRLRAFGSDGDTLAGQIENSLAAMRENNAVPTTYGDIKVPKPKEPTLVKIPEFKAEEPAVTTPKPVPAPEHPPLQLTAGPAEQRAAEEVLKGTDRVPVGPDFEAELRRTLTPEEFQNMQKEHIKEVAKSRQHAGAKGVGGFLTHGGLSTWALAEMLRGAWKYGTALLGARILISLDEKWVGKLLQNEKVVDWLSRPTKAELEVADKMTPEQKAVFGEGLQKLIDAAGKKGKKVDPAWVGLAGAAVPITAGGRKIPEQPEENVPWGPQPPNALNHYHNPEDQPPAASYDFNKNWAKPGPYVTQLTPDQEQKFQQWVRENHIPWQDVPDADYDMRGYWQALTDPSNPYHHLTGRVEKGAFKGHFDDRWKTPYSGVFSKESMYATADAPHWEGDKLVTSDGRLVTDETPLKSPKQSVGQSAASPTTRAQNLQSYAKAVGGFAQNVAKVGLVPALLSLLRTPSPTNEAGIPAHISPTLAAKPSVVTALAHPNRRDLRLLATLPPDERAQVENGIRALTADAQKQGKLPYRAGWATILASGAGEAGGGEGKAA